MPTINVKFIDGVFSESQKSPLQSAPSSTGRAAAAVARVGT